LKKLVIRSKNSYPFKKKDAAFQTADVICLKGTAVVRTANGTCSGK